MSNKFHQISRDVHIYSWGYRLNTHVYSLDVNLLFSFFNSGRKKRNELKTRVETKYEEIGIRLIRSKSIGGRSKYDIFG